MTVKLHEKVIKESLKRLFKLLYRVEIEGLEHAEALDSGAVIVCNHVSFLDAPILACFLPGKPIFAINTYVAKLWWVRPWLKLINAFPIDNTNALSMKSLIQHVKNGEKCILFPEGRLTETGALMKVYEGPAMIADKASAPIVPIRLEGLQHTPFARLKGRVTSKFFPKVTVSILKPKKLEISENIKGKERNEAVGKELYSIMEAMMFETQKSDQTLFQALLRSKYVNGPIDIVEDSKRDKMNLKQLIKNSFLVGEEITRFSKKGENIGLLIPNSVNNVVSFFALNAFGRVPAIINYLDTPENISTNCDMANIKTIISSKDFWKSQSKEITSLLISKGIKIVFIEDLLAKITPFKILNTINYNYEKMHSLMGISANDPCLILFSKTPSGKQKGIVLSHKNLNSNISQVRARMDLNASDKVFNALHTFNYYGLTGTLLPILSGVSTFLHSKPAQYRAVPEMVYLSNTTIMLSTDTFLRGYAKYAHPYDFYRVRYIFSGTEKLKNSTQKIYMKKFGIRILQSYGTSGTSSILAINSPMHYKSGSVGRILAGIDYKLQAIPGVKDGKRLLVSGENIMLGYLDEKNPGHVKPKSNKWHDTGDVVEVNSDGCVKLHGRSNRYINRSNEMVSLAKIESIIDKIYPDSDHAILAYPYLHDCEDIILVTTNSDANIEEIYQSMNNMKIEETQMPTIVLHKENLKNSIIGRVDYLMLHSWISEQMDKYKKQTDENFLSKNQTEPKPKIIKASS